MASDAVEHHTISIRLACVIFYVSQSCYRYEAKQVDDNQLIAQWLIKLTSEHQNWGFGLCFAYIRNVKGFKFNHKRIYHIYCELALNLRIKPKCRIQRERPSELTEPEHINDIWSLDFMHDNLSNGNSYRVLNVIDDYRREALAMEADVSLPAIRVVGALEQLLESRKAPKVIRCDNGPEFISHELQRWAKQHQIRIEYIEPGKPQQNAYIERYNCTVRYGLLNQHLFTDITEVQDYATKWLWFYNHERPHKANGGKPPSMNYFSTEYSC